MALITQSRKHHRLRARVRVAPRIAGVRDHFRHAATTFCMPSRQPRRHTKCCGCMAKVIPHTPRCEGPLLTRARRRWCLRDCVIQVLEPFDRGALDLIAPSCPRKGVIRFWHAQAPGRACAQLSLSLTDDPRERAKTRERSGHPQRGSARRAPKTRRVHRTFAAGSRHAAVPGKRGGRFTQFVPRTAPVEPKGSDLSPETDVKKTTPVVVLQVRLRKVSHSRVPKDWPEKGRARGSQSAHRPSMQKLRRKVPRAQRCAQSGIRASVRRWPRGYLIRCLRNHGDVRSNRPCRGSRSAWRNIQRRPVRAPRGRTGDDFRLDTAAHLR